MEPIDSLNINVTMVDHLEDSAANTEEEDEKQTISGSMGFQDIVHNTMKKAFYKQGRIIVR